VEFPDDYVDKYDPDNLLIDIKELPSQFLKGYELPEKISFEGKTFSRILCAGMGGSSIASFVVQTYLNNLETPFLINREYHLPKYIGEETLVIAVSYSGNTEETLSSYREAIRRRCSVVSLATGGKLEELSRINGTQFVRLPSGHVPRAVIGFTVGALLRILSNIGIIKNQKAELEKTVSALKKDVFTEPAIKLSEKLVGKVPIIYSSTLFYPIAYRWQTQINENTKALAISHCIPEQNHNELQGFINAGKQGKFHMVILKSQDDSPRIQKRMDITKEIAQKNGISVTEIGIKGNSFLTRLFSGAMIGELTSYFLALRYETNPSPMDDIEFLKKKLGPFV